MKSYEYGFVHDDFWIVDCRVVFVQVAVIERMIDEYVTVYTVHTNNSFQLTDICKKYIFYNQKLTQIAIFSHNERDLNSAPKNSLTSFELRTIDLHRKSDYQQNLRGWFLGHTLRLSEKFHPVITCW